jgi:acyl dehydratase
MNGGDEGEARNEGHPIPLRVRYDSLGTTIGPFAYEATTAGISTYAEATNDCSPSAREGSVAPPPFAIVPVSAAIDASLEAFLPNEVGQGLNTVHAEHAYELIDPIRSGDSLLTTGTPLGCANKRTGSIIVVETETRRAAGDLVNRQWFTLFIKGVVMDDHGSHPTLDPTPPPLASSTTTVRRRIDPDQTYRYATASGDHSAIHLEDEVARAAGFPGIIVHGALTLAIASGAIVDEFCDGDGSRVSWLSGRFSSIVRPGQDVAVRIRRHPSGTVLDFEVVDDSGTTFLSRGKARVRATKNMRLAST